MGSIAVLGIEGGNIELDQEVVEGLSTSLRGEVLLPGGETYDEARTIWNAMVDRRPGLIVRCLGSADVVRAVSFVREHGLLTAVRSGGHNIAGNAVCEGGMMIDLSQMK
jgi:FAD/FMN-containing dehydrogenase